MAGLDCVVGVESVRWDKSPLLSTKDGNINLHFADPLASVPNRPTGQGIRKMTRLRVSSKISYRCVFSEPDLAAGIDSYDDSTYIICENLV